MLLAGKRESARAFTQALRNSCRWGICDPVFLVTSRMHSWSWAKASPPYLRIAALNGNKEYALDSQTVFLLFVISQQLGKRLFRNCTKPLTITPLRQCPSANVTYCLLCSQAMNRLLDNCAGCPTCLPADLLVSPQLLQYWEEKVCPNWKDNR